MATTRERPWMCHACGHVMDAASVAFQNNLTNIAPEDGDYSVCINCGQCHTRHGTSWQRTTAAELADMHPDNRQQLALMQTGIDLLRRPGLTRLRASGQTANLS